MSKEIKISIGKLLKLYLNEPYQFLKDDNIENIIRLIKYADDKYYSKNTNVMTDEEYDLLIDYIKKKDPDNNIFNQIGAPIKKDKIILPYYMGSMDKIKPTDPKFLEKFKNLYPGPYIYSDKLDGISALFLKSYNKLHLYTRGDGYEGTDISILIDHINFGIDIKKLYEKMNNGVAIRGEIIMSKENFKKYDKEFKNARNLVSGVINSKKLTKHILKDIDFVSYEIINPWITNHLEQFKELKNFKINTVYHDKLSLLEFSNLSNILKDRKHNINNLYEIDGIICSSQNIDKVRSKDRNPIYAFAFKDILENQHADIKVLNVEWNISKDGYIKPVIILEKTDLAGVTISRVTGFNAKYIKDNVIGIGSIVTVIRSGDVIPHITSIKKKSSNNKPLLPTYKYNWTDTNVDIIVDNDTIDQLIKELTYFVKNLNIKNISEQSIKKFIDSDIDSIIKIINITKNDLSNVQGFKETMINKIYDEIELAVNNLTMLQLMTASNLFGHGIAERKIKKLLEEYPNILDLYKKKSNEELLKLLIEIDSYDTITAKHIINGLCNFMKLYDELKPILKKQLLASIKPKIVNNNHIFYNKKIIFSGFRNKEWEKYIEDNGGKIVTTISPKIDILVTKQINIDEQKNSKLLKAQELNIKIIAMENFEKKYIK